MFSYLFGKSSSTSSRINLNNKQQAIENCKKQIPIILKQACTDFKTSFPTASIPAFDENQQWFNSWTYIFHDVLLAILYLPQSIKMCKALLDNISNIALDASKDNCSNREDLNESLMQHLKDYNELCWIELLIHGKLLLNQGSLTLYLGANTPLAIGLKPYDLAALQLTNLSVISQEEALDSLVQIQAAIKDLIYNSVLISYFLETLQQVVGQAFVRMTPIFNHYSLLEELVETALRTADPAALHTINSKFVSIVNEISAMHAINTSYGQRTLGKGDLNLQFANCATLQVKLPITDADNKGLTQIDELTEDNISFVLTQIKNIKRGCILQLHQDFAINKNKVLDDSESDSDEDNLKSFLNRRC